MENVFSRGSREENVAQQQQQLQYQQHLQLQQLQQQQQQQQLQQQQQQQQHAAYIEANGNGNLNQNLITNPNVNLNPIANPNANANSMHYMQHHRSALVRSTVGSNFLRNNFSFNNNNNSNNNSNNNRNLAASAIAIVTGNATSRKRTHQQPQQQLQHHEKQERNCERDFRLIIDDEFDDDNEDDDDDDDDDDAVNDHHQNEIDNMDADNDVNMDEYDDENERDIRNNNNHNKSNDDRHSLASDMHQPMQIDDEDDDDDDDGNDADDETTTTPVIDELYQHFAYAAQNKLLRMGQKGAMKFRCELCRSAGACELHEAVSNESLNLLYQLRCNDLLCDAILSVEDAVFNVHSPMLCTCSSYFRAIFTGGLNYRSPPKPKGLKQFVHIPEISGAIMEELIKYAYLRHSRIADDNVHELLVTADYLGIIGVLDRCKLYLFNSLTPENCVSIMNFARFRLLDDLYAKTRLYVLRYFPQVMAVNEDLLQLELNDFYEIISDDDLNTRDEDLVWRMCLKWIEYDADNRRQHIAFLMHGVRLGLMTAKCFMEEVKEHPLVLGCEAAKPLIVETFKFMYDLDIINPATGALPTPALAMPRQPHEIIFAIGGWSGGTARTWIETYDTRSDRWIVLSSSETNGPRAYHGSAVIDFKIYCIGGYDGVEYFNKCHVFDAVAKTWSEIAPMHFRRCYVSAAVLNGKIYAIGGYDGLYRLNSVERYDPQTNQWTLMAPLTTQRSDASCCAINGKIYAFGGFNGQECLDSAEVYDPNINKWARIADMTQRRSGVSSVAFRGCAYVIGGFNGTARLASGERFDPQLDAWSSICEMNHPRSNFGLEVIDDMVFAIGGFDGISTISHSECYVPETNEWMEATNMNYVRSALTVNNVGGLPNRLDYIYKDRDRLVEERKQRLLANAMRRAVEITITRQIVVNQHMDQVVAAAAAGAGAAPAAAPVAAAIAGANEVAPINDDEEREQPPSAPSAQGAVGGGIGGFPPQQQAQQEAAAIANGVAFAHQNQSQEIRELAFALLEQNRRLRAQLREDASASSRSNDRNARQLN